MNDLIKSILPWIGTALGGPLGAVAASTVGSALGLQDKTVDNIKQVLTGMTPEQLQALKQAEMDTQVKMMELGYTSVKDLADIESKNIETVNKTMQVEATAEHWPTYSWRPYNGFLFGTTIFAVYFLLPLFHIKAPEIPEAVWVAWGGMLGIASFFRGKAQADPSVPATVQIPAQHGVVKAVLGQ